MLGDPLIERFYSSSLTLADQVRILVGWPPVPISRALRVMEKRQSILYRSRLRHRASCMDPIVSQADRTHQKGSKSFALAAKLLPRDTRYDAMMLYAWCRHCDDVIDDQILGFASGTASAETPAERGFGSLGKKPRPPSKAALMSRSSSPLGASPASVASPNAIRWSF